MAEDSDVTLWLEKLKGSDAAVAQKLWDRYFQQLVRFAASRLPSSARRARDEEDIALSAFTSFCLGVERGRFPQLNDREDLWHLLLTITARKVQAHLRHETRQKRGGAPVHDESAPRNQETPESADLRQIASPEPTPEFAAQAAEEFERLMAALDDDALRNIAQLKMEGYTRAEIAQQTGSSCRSVARRLELIRRIWSEAP